MKTGELATTLRNNASHRVYITHEGERFNPGKVSDLIGSDPADTIIEANGTDPVPAGRLAATLDVHQDPDGDAQLFLGDDESFAYYDVGHIAIAYPSGDVHLQVGAFRTGGG